MFITSKSYGEIIDEMYDESNYNRRVVQIHPITGNFVIWENAHIVGVMLNINSSHIRAVCNGERIHHHGYYWRYLDEFFKTGKDNTQYIKSYPDPNDNSIIKTQFKCSPLDLPPVGGNLKNYLQPQFIPFHDERLMYVYDKKDYQISDYGRVISLKFYPYIYQIFGTINFDGYKKMKLDGNFYSTHKLVADMFIPNPDNLPCINHLDENKLNNHVSNLAHCTIEENNRWGTRGFRCTRHLCKKVEQYDLITDKTIKFFDSIQEAAKETNINYRRIGEVCNKKQKSAGGYGFRFKEIDQ